MQRNMQVEVFHIYHQGEQRGPYTVRQIGHLHRCGFIDDATMYWREGMEQWHSISEIVFIRHRRNRILLWSIAAGMLALLSFFWWLFGGVTVQTWHEMTSGEYTAQSAWWRARGLLRDQLSSGGILKFDAFETAHITLTPPASAVVKLSGLLRHVDGHTEQAAWQVKLQHDPGRGLWSLATKENQNTQ